MEKKLSLLSLALLLAACGGGGGGDNHVADQQTPRPDGSARDPLFTTTLDSDDLLLGYSQLDILIDGKKYAYSNVAERRETVDPNALPRGLSSAQTLHISMRKTDGSTESETVTSRSYRGFHSGVVISDILRVLADPSEELTGLDISYYTPTPATGLPSAGRATYHGQAFGFQHDNNAAFQYHVNFADKTGYGEVAANRYHPAIYLARETLRQKRDADRTYYEFEGSNDYKRSPRGSYELVLSGPGAEEIIGSVDFSHENEAQILALFGTRGEITP